VETLIDMNKWFSKKGEESFGKFKVWATFHDLFINDDDRFLQFGYAVVQMSNIVIESIKYM
jgi:hypothetical protein